MYYMIYNNVIYNNIKIIYKELTFFLLHCYIVTILNEIIWLGVTGQKP